MGRKKKEQKNKSDKKDDIDESVEDELRTNLEEIKTYDDVIGYILRNSTSATIDLKDPTKVIDYALLSSSAFDISKVLSEKFHLGEVKNIIIEGKDAKMLSLTVDENKTSVFMHRKGDFKKIMKKIG